MVRPVRVAALALLLQLLTTSTRPPASPTPQPDATCGPAVSSDGSSRIGETRGLGPRSERRETFSDVLRGGGRGPEMLAVPAGTFRMGCDVGCVSNERPAHRVTIPRPFAIAKYAVTFEEYDRFATATGRERPNDGGWGRGRRPVIRVSWLDAQNYVAWLSRETGASYRLPSEAEWEYAARAGTTTPYSWGRDVGRNRANCDGCGSRWDYEMTAPVGSFAANANAWGLHDMHGNIWEWVQDCWHDSYEGAPTDGSVWSHAGACRWRVLRGGSWYFGPRTLRAAYRLRIDAANRSPLFGIRVARTLSGSRPN